MCHGVVRARLVVLLIGVLAAGCALVHERPELDAGPGLDATVPRDARVEPDAWRQDAFEDDAWRPDAPIDAFAVDAFAIDAWRPDAFPNDMALVDASCPDGRDLDGDGIADGLEPAPGDDEDGDTIDDRTENLVRTLLTANDAAHGSPPIPTPDVCIPDDCDGDGLRNFVDIDSDDDGLPDRLEGAAGTNQCLRDTDHDGFDDLIEVAIGTSPLDPTAMPPPNALYAPLPFDPPGSTARQPRRQFDFSTRIRIADVFVLVDNSASMQAIINELRATFSSTIVPGILAQIPDVRIGVGSFDSVPDGLDGDAGRPGDYTLWVRQPLSADSRLSQRALDAMTTVDRDIPGMMFFGLDGPECQVEALLQVIDGPGMIGHEADEAARWSVHDARDRRGDGWVPRVDPVRDCGAAPGDDVFGWGCFRAGRVPIVVLASDAGWHQGFVTGSDGGGPGSDATMHPAADLATAMIARQAYFIGIDVGDTGDTLAESRELATRTGTVDGSGNPIVFHPGSGGLASAATDVVHAITTLAGETAQDITTRVDADPTETRLPAGHTTADFLTAVRPDHGSPDAPIGFARMDATTFYGVRPSTRVTFDVDFRDDFVAETDAPQLYRATIQVLGRADTIVDHHDVYIVVPPIGGTPSIF